MYFVNQITEVIHEMSKQHPNNCNVQKHTQFLHFNISTEVEMTSYIFVSTQPELVHSTQVFQWYCKDNVVLAFFYHWHNIPLS